MPADLQRYPTGPMPQPLSLSAAQRQEGLQALRDFAEQLAQAVAALNDKQLDTPYRAGGWTVRQVVHHLADSHANAYIRLKLSLTEDNPTIKPYEEALWAELGDSRLSVQPSLELLHGLHTRMVALFESLTEAQFARRWTHPASGEWTVDTLLAMYAWHGRHHLAHIQSLRIYEV